jgi:phage repressor protein C with HTH and peptisase S24 domain
MLFRNGHQQLTLMRRRPILARVEKSELGALSRRSPLGLLWVQIRSKLMPGDLPTGGRLDGETPFSGDLLSGTQDVVDGRLLDPNHESQSGLTPQGIFRAPKRGNAITHDDNEIDFSMPKSIEIAMGQDIENPITLIAMQTYGQRVRVAREHAGLSQAQLGKAIGGLKQPSVLAIEKRDTKSKYTLEIAKITGVRAEWLETGEGKMLPEKLPITKNQTDEQQKPLITRDINIYQMLQDIPILGGGACGEDGLFELNGEILGFARRPPSLVGIKDVYAIYVYGESMIPWREPRDLVYVHPHQPIHVKDYVVVQLHPERGTQTSKVYIKRLVRRTADSLRLQQYNPAEEITLPMKRVKALHRVMDWSELLGL